MQRLMTIVLACVSAVWISSGSASANNFAIMGFGVSTCAQFGQLYKSAPAEWESDFFTWAQGFMSGMNSGAIVAGTQTRNLAAMSANEQEMFLRSYCDSHPLQSYMEAVLALTNTLPLNPPRKH